MIISLGANAKAFFLSTGSRATWGALNATTGFHEGTAPSNLTEITCIGGEVTVDDGGASVEATTRGNSPVESHDYGLDKYSVTLPLKWLRTDTFIAALLKARGNRTGIAIAILDADKAVSGALGYWGDWVIDGAPKSEPIGDAQMITVTLRPWSGSAVKPVERVKVT